MSSIIKTNRSSDRTFSARQPSTMSICESVSMWGLKELMPAFSVPHVWHLLFQFHVVNFCIAILFCVCLSSSSHCICNIWSIVFFNSRYLFEKFSVMVSLTHKNIEKQAPLPNPNAHKWQINTKEAKAKAFSHSTWCFKELVPAFFFPRVWHWLKLLRHSLQFCELGIIDQIFLLHFCEICVNNPLLFPLDTVL